MFCLARVAFRVKREHQSLLLFYHYQNSLVVMSALVFVKLVNEFVSLANNKKTKYTAIRLVGSLPRKSVRTNSLSYLYPLFQLIRQNIF